MRYSITALQLYKCETRNYAYAYACAWFRLVWFVVDDALDKTNEQSNVLMLVLVMVLVTVMMAMMMMVVPGFLFVCLSFCAVCVCVLGSITFSVCVFFLVNRA